VKEKEFLTGKKEDGANTNRQMARTIDTGGSIMQNESIPPTEDGLTILGRGERSALGRIKVVTNPGERVRGGQRKGTTFSGRCTVRRGRASSREGGIIPGKEKRLKKAEGIRWGKGHLSHGILSSGDPRNSHEGREGY